MNFKQFFETKDDFLDKVKELSKTSPYVELKRKIVQKVSEENNMPLPTTYLDEGMEAYIFNTEDPDIVARISTEQNTCDKIMHRPEFQNSGGVAKIYGLYDKIDHVVSYKEKVDIFWEAYVRRTYPEQKNKILGHINSINPYTSEKEMEIIVNDLKQFPETKGFAKAIELGIPTRDISENNIGITKENKIVIIDC